ncbi:MAG: hypothetical protein LLF98_02580 [Clostridium sp.]|uniref:hypothetical protein n=1 Tax=Clostridium sp. TaxID=1506 RepID=UPI0025C6B1B3|nr:hypothetical protein [Clostridium sp.]MCE5220169.1 hypothetical protein [Clostridium sp.]
MLNKQVGVIRNQDGYFVNMRQIKGGHYYTLYNGITTGFTFYENKKTMDNDLKILGEGFYTEYISLKDIPDGIRISTNKINKI